MIISRFQKSSEEAVNTLNEIMLDETTTPSLRVQAAKKVLDVAYRSIEVNILKS